MKSRGRCIAIGTSRMKPRHARRRGAHLGLYVWGKSKDFPVCSLLVMGYWTPRMFYCFKAYAPASFML